MTKIEDCKIRLQIVLRHQVILLKNMKEVLIILKNITEDLRKSEKKFILQIRRKRRMNFLEIRYRVVEDFMPKLTKRQTRLMDKRRSKIISIRTRRKMGRSKMAKITGRRRLQMSERFSKIILDNPLIMGSRLKKYQFLIVEITPKSPS